MIDQAHEKHATCSSACPLLPIPPRALPFASGFTTASRLQPALPCRVCQLASGRMGAKAGALALATSQGRRLQAHAPFATIILRCPACQCSAARSLLTNKNPRYACGHAPPRKRRSRRGAGLKGGLCVTRPGGRLLPSFRLFRTPATVLRPACPISGQRISSKVHAALQHGTFRSSAPRSNT